MKGSNWVNHLAITNMKKHFRRNVFSIISLIVGLTSSFLIIGFSENAENSIKEQCYRQIDYGCLTISKDVKTESKNGGLSIVRSTRPTRQEIYGINKTLKNYIVDLNFDSLLPSIPYIKYQKTELKEFSYNPIYSFYSPCVDKSLLIEGKYPLTDSLKEVVINQKASEVLTSVMGSSPLGKSLNIYFERESTYYDDEEAITDYFIYDKTVRIVGVVNDLNFLATPKIYYSYLGLKDYLSEVYLNNLSTYLNKDFSWVNRVDQANNSDEISSYSYRLFIKNYKDNEKASDEISLISEPYSITSGAITRSEALLSLINAATTGMEIFLVIALLGTSLIMGIVSFSFYSEEKKTIAILSCLGAKMDDINDIYCVENVLIGLIAFIISILLSPLLQVVINMVVNNFTGFNNIVIIPFMRFKGIPFGFPLIVLTGTLLVCLFATLLPISFSKKISLKEELKDE